MSAFQPILLIGDDVGSHVRQQSEQRRQGTEKQIEWDDLTRRA